jgi:hypothetical protein
MLDKNGISSTNYISLKPFLPNPNIVSAQVDLQTAIQYPALFTLELPLAGLLTERNAKLVR